MKKFAFSFVLSAFAAFAGTYTGVVSDAGCGAKHVDGSDASIACVKRCAERTGKLVFVVGDVVYNIDSGDNGKLTDYLGKKAKITGTLAEGKLNIEKVEQAD